MGLESAVNALASYRASVPSVRYEIVSTIAETSAEFLLKALRHTFSPRLGQHREIWSAVQSLADAGPSFPLCWHRSLHRCRQAVSSKDSADALAAAIEVLLQYPHFVPKRVDVGNRITVRLLSDTGWEAVPLSGFEMIGEGELAVWCDTPNDRRLFRARPTRFDASSFGAVGRWAPTIIGTPLAVAAARPRVAEALRLLRDVDPKAASWVRGVTRTLAIIEAPRADLSVSSSDFALPGEIALSIPGETAGLAETLVHECSHQYLHIAELLGSVDNGKDDRLYYSPIKRAARPIRAILVAFHAFANVALYYEAVLKRSLSPRARAYSDMHRARNSADLEVLSEHLQVSRGLTIIGESLWRPLYKTLRSRRILAA